MIGKYAKRLQALEGAAKDVEMLRRSRAPFVLYRPRCFALDQHYLLYYPEGLHQRPHKYGPLAGSALCDALRSYPAGTRLDVSMCECTEWLYALYYHSDHAQLYTQEQRDRMMVEDMKAHPELAYMATEEGRELLQILLRFPQVMTVQVKDFMEAYKEA